ncbi:MAG: heat-shock protein [Pseudomonadales bacterium]|nr:heat-shock protein [Pseudomonadales bacterium]
MSNKKAGQVFNFGHNDPHIQNWGCFTYQGAELSLEHLNAHKVRYESESQAYDVYVTYSHHCFAKTEDGNDAEVLLFQHKKDPRHFHKERYDLSLELPRLIPMLPELYTFHGGGRDQYCSCKLMNSAGEEINYLISYTVFKSIKKMRLHITSAYPADTGKKRKVGFMKVLTALHQGRTLPGK